MTRLKIYAVLTCLTLAVYGRVVSYPPILLDDPSVGLDRPHGITMHNIGWSFATTSFANWMPLTWISYLVDDFFYAVRPVVITPQISLSILSA